MSQKSISQITKAISAIYYKRYESVYHKSMNVKQKKKIIFTLEEAYVRERLIYEFTGDGKLVYYAGFMTHFMGEFDELVVHIPSLYCVEDKKIRARFYKAIHKKAKEIAQLQKIKRMMIEVSLEDETSKKHFSQTGFLTYIELVGKTSEGLKKLKAVDFKKSEYKISKLEARDVKKLIELDLKSHINDKSSRMRKPFMKPDAKEKMMKPFYNALLTQGNCYVAKLGNRPVGDIGFFIDKENKLGLIACIFVANEYQNKGIAKLLYKKALEDFSEKKLRYYLGATTTKGVLAAAKKIGRKESKSAYLVKI